MTRKHWRVAVASSHTSNSPFSPLSSLRTIPARYVTAAVVCSQSNSTPTIWLAYSDGAVEVLSAKSSVVLERLLPPTSPQIIHLVAFSSQYLPQDGFCGVHVDNKITLWDSSYLSLGSFALPCHTDIITSCLCVSPDILWAIGKRFSLIHFFSKSSLFLYLFCFVLFLFSIFTYF
jgi:hypothetical protein